MWRMAPWRRAPLLLGRRPGVAVALAAAAFVAALPAAAAAPFLSSSANATLHSQIRKTCAGVVGAQVSYDMAIYSDHDFVFYFGPPLDRAKQLAKVKATEQKLTSIAAAGSGLAAPHTFWYSSTTRTRLGGDNPTVTMMATDDFASHVRVVSGPSGAGVWVPDAFAAIYGLKVGQVLTFDSPYDADTTLRIAAIYKDLSRQPDVPYFCEFHELIYGPPGAEYNRMDPVPPIFFVDRDTFAKGAPFPYRGQVVMSFWLTDQRPHADQTGPTLDTIERLRAAALDPSVACSVCVYYARFGPGVAVESQMPALVARAALARDAIRPAAIPITVAGATVGLIVVAAAAVFWVLRRRQELAVLSAHGMGAVSIAVKAAAEALPALLAGTALAWAGATWLVRAVGPAPVVAHTASVDSLRAAVATLGLALAVVALAAGLRSRTLADEAHVRRRFRPAAWPWELLVVAGAGYAWQRLGTGTVTRTTPGSNGGQVVHVPAALLVVPLLAIVGALVLLARVATAVLRRRSGPGPGRSVAAYLGWRRLVREAVIVAVLAGATAMPVGLATYGAAVTDSVRATVDGEAHLIVGADVVVTLSRRAPIPASLTGHATEVLSLRAVHVDGIAVNLWGVDPAKFASVAYWHGQMPGGSLDSILAPLRAPHPDGAPWPAVSSEPQIPAGTFGPDWGLSTDTRYDVRGAELLPAQQGGFGSLIVPAASLGREADFATPQLWIRGDPAKILPELTAANLPIAYVATPTTVYTGTVFEPLTYTFQYLTALSILTGVVTVVGLMLYIEARSPGHRRGYVMARRMGLSAGTHRRALLLELAVPLLTGLGAGIGLALGLTEAFSAGFDVDPRQPPHTLIALPGPTIGGISLAVAVVAVAAAVFAQVRVGRANPAEVLRDTI